MNLHEAKISLGLGRRAGDPVKILDDLRRARWVVFDTETTGLRLGPTTMVTEIAAVAVDGATGQVLDRFHLKAKLEPAVRDALRSSGRAKIAQVLKMTRYGDRNTAFKPLRDVLVGFREFVRQQKNPLLIAHNAKFDMKQVNSALKRLGERPLKGYRVFDTVSLTRVFVYPLLLALRDLEIPEIEQKLAPLLTYRKGRDGKSRPKLVARLENLGKAFGVPAEHWHSGLSDAVQLARIVGRIVAFAEKYRSALKSPEFARRARKETAREWNRQWFFKAGPDWRKKRGLG